MDNSYILKTQKFIIREDDFDPRYSFATVKNTHELFLQKNLIHTLAIQAKRHEGVGHTQEVIDYINSTSNWDIQLHGWDHDRYSDWKYNDIVRDLFAGIGYCQQMFKRVPTVFYPPWNCESNVLKQACQYVGLQFNNNCAYIMSYTNTPESYQDKNVIYFHNWDLNNSKALPKLLDMAMINI